MSDKFEIIDDDVIFEGKVLRVSELKAGSIVFIDCGERNTEMIREIADACSKITNVNNLIFVNSYNLGEIELKNVLKIAKELEEKYG